MSRHEFTDGIRRAGFDAKQSDLNAIFDDMDIDGSGELEYEELQVKLQQYDARAHDGAASWIPSAAFLDL